MAGTHNRFIAAVAIVAVAGFGVNGVVDCKVDDQQTIDPTGKHVGDDIGLNAGQRQRGATGFGWRCAGQR